MSKDNNNSFSEEQQQYLAGFAFGTDVARAVSRLPVISGSGGANGSTAALGVGGAKVDGETLPVGPERIALQAQADTVKAGKKLCNQETAKQAKNPLDMWDEIHHRPQGLCPRHRRIARAT